jgi:nucleoside-diphosphate-sugar epimerase
MIGGTGLIGFEVAKLLIDKGHDVVTIALREISKKLEIPKGMTIVYGNYLEMSDEELLSLMMNADAFVFAAGIDERIEGPAPIYDLFKKYNIDSLQRLLELAKKTRIKHTVICGSYFSYFAKHLPHLELTKHHPYIRSRIDQENIALSYASDDFHIAIIELPYIFGVQPGRKPVWVFLVEMIRKMKKHTFYPKGGTTLITVRQAAEGIVGAIEKNRGGNTYPLGYYNMEWKEFLSIVHEALGYSKKRKVITIPNFLFKLYVIYLDKQRKKKNIEGGLNLRKFVRVQTSKLFIEPTLSADYLGVREDDIKAAIKDSIALSLLILDNEEDVIDMKIE